jgi:hypothetical protein
LLLEGLGSQVGEFGVFCGTADNASYRTMFIAATSGIGLAALVMLRIPPLAFDALGIFEVALAMGLAIGSVAIRAVIPALFWFAAAMAISLVRGFAPSSQPPPSARGSFGASAVLLTLATAFVAFPVLQPWSGPPEPFVRWHPYFTDAELVWRAIFLAFAIGMVAAASDPFGRGKDFLLALGISGLFHASAMALDNLVSALRGGPNGNPEHAYGDVLGWFLIAAFALAALRAARRARAAELAPARS